MKDNLHVLIYSAVLGLVCASLLAGAAKFTEPYREMNAKAEETRHILDVLEVPYSPKASAADLQKVLQENIRKAPRGGLEVYEYVPAQAGGKVTAVVVPFAGQGVWGPIKGFLALEPDMKTIRGITFSQQEETPGLGGEIGNPEFTKKFKGKTIVDAEGRPGFRIGGPGLTGPNKVDAVSGATLTSNKVEQMLNVTIQKIGKTQDSHGQ